MAEVDPLVGFHSTNTQRIANYLAQWQEIRKLRHSQGQRLINAMYGIHFDEVEEGLDRSLRDMLLELSDLNQPDVVSRLVLPSDAILDVPVDNRNLIRNSSFERWTVPAKMPDIWTSTGTVAVVGGLVGYRAVQLSTPSNGTSTAIQTVKEQVPVDVPHTFSVWYRIPSHALSLPSTDFGLRITGTRPDGNTDTIEKLFKAHTDNEWARLTLSYTPTQDWVKFDFEIRVTRTDSFPFASTVQIDAAQVERGDTSTPWRSNIQDTLPYFSNRTRTGIRLESNHHMWFTDNLEDFWFKAIPTRHAIRQSWSEVRSAPTSAGSTRTVDFSKREWDVVWTLNGNKIEKRIKDPVVADSLLDTLASYDIAYRNENEKFEIQTSGITMEAMTWFAGRLWLVVSETDFSSSTIRSLYILEPRTNHPEPSYLEAIAGIKLDIPNTAVMCEFRNEDQQHIYINDGSTTYVVRLYYDLFTVDGGSRLLYMREKHANIGVVWS